MLVFDQPGLLVLQPREQLPQRLGRPQPQPQRHRVDQQPDHPFHTGQLRRTSRNRDPEHHVRTAGQPRQQQPHAACTSVLSVTA